MIKDSCSRLNFTDFKKCENWRNVSLGKAVRAIPIAVTTCI